MRMGTVGGTQPTRSRSSAALRGESSTGWPIPFHCMVRTMRTAKMAAGPLRLPVVRIHLQRAERHLKRGSSRRDMSR